MSMNTETLHFHDQKEQWAKNTGKCFALSCFRGCWECLDNAQQHWRDGPWLLQRHLHFLNVTTVKFCRGGRINSVLKKNRTQSATLPLSEIRQVIEMYQSQDGGKEMLWGKQSTNLISSCLINNSKRITPQLPANVIWCDQAAITVSTLLQHLCHRDNSSTSKNPFPTLVLCLYAVANEGNYRTRTAHPGSESKHLRQEPVFRGVGSQGNIMLQPVPRW